MILNTRRPTGLPPWPIILLGGREKAGKSWAAATASASPLIDRTLWIGIGEDDPDEYGQIEGADFEIVTHDGSYAQILGAARAVAQLPENGRPHLLIVDSMTKLWDLIVDNAQAIANQRAKGRKTASGDYSISPDLWNVAKKQWDDFMDAVRDHHGPVILTARLDLVMVMEDGQPTKEKAWKVQAHKSLPFDAGVVVEMHERGHALITGVRSVRMAIERPVQVPKLTIAELWMKLGLTEGTSTRVHSGTVTDDPSVEAAVAMWGALAKEQTTVEGIRQVYKDARAAGVVTEVLDGIRDIAAAFEQPAAALPQAAPETVQPPLAGASAGRPAKRNWQAEMARLETQAEAKDLVQQATLASAPAAVIEELAALASKKVAEPAPVESWAAAEIPQTDGWDTPMAIADEAAGEVEI